MSGYKVTAALVVAKDQAGKNRHVYRGGWVPWLGDEQREHFLRHKLVEEVGDDEVAAPAGSTGSGKPAKVATKEAWVEWGVQNGHDRAELEALSKADLIDLLS